MSIAGSEAGGAEPITKGPSPSGERISSLVPGLVGSGVGVAEGSGVADAVVDSDGSGLGAGGAPRPHAVRATARAATTIDPEIRRRFMLIFSQQTRPDAIVSWSRFDDNR